jgi:hypothetical protein
MRHSVFRTLRATWTSHISARSSLALILHDNSSDWTNAKSVRAPQSCKLIRSIDDLVHKVKQIALSRERISSLRLVETNFGLRILSVQCRRDLACELAARFPCRTSRGVAVNPRVFSNLHWRIDESPPILSTLVTEDFLGDYHRRIKRPVLHVEQRIIP